MDATTVSHVGWDIYPTIRVDHWWRWPKALLVLGGVLLRAVVTHPHQTLRPLLPHRCTASRCDLIQVSLNGHRLLRIPNSLRGV